MPPQRLPIVNSDDGVWGDILRQYLMKEHYNDDTDNAVNGGHQKITVRAGTTAVGTAPLKFTSSTSNLLTTPEAGAMEFDANTLYFTPSTTRKRVALYDSTGGATGDIYYRDSSGYFTRLSVGGTGNLLTVASGIPSWTSTIAISALATTGTASSSTFLRGDGAWTALGSTTYTSNVGDGSTTSYVITHNLGTRNVAISVYDATTYEEVNVDKFRTSVNTVTLTFATAPATNAYVCVISNGALTTTVNSTDIADSTSTGRSVVTAASAAAARTAISALGTAESQITAGIFIPGTTSTPTAAGITTLTISSAQVQIFTGSSTQTVKLSTTSVTAGLSYTIINQSTGDVTVQSSGANTINILKGGSSGIYIAKIATPTGASDWYSQNLSGTRINTITSSATPSINVDTTNQFNITALATAITSMSSGLSGTPADGQRLMIRIKDDGTARAITWGSSFQDGPATAITTTSASKTHELLFKYNSVVAKWICMAADSVGY